MNISFFLACICIVLTGMLVEGHGYAAAAVTGLGVVYLLRLRNCGVDTRERARMTSPLPLRLLPSRFRGMAGAVAAFLGGHARRANDPALLRAQLRQRVGVRILAWLSGHAARVRRSSYVVEHASALYVTAVTAQCSALPAK
jgi:hypothetical protein